MPESFLTGVDVDDLIDVSLSGYLTKLSVYGGTVVRLARWNPDTETYEQLQPVVVVREREAQVLTALRGTAEIAATVDGFFTAPAPWDVRTGDRFAVTAGDGDLLGDISYVMPPRLGLQTCGYSLRLGGTA